MWFSFWRSRDRFTLNELRYLVDQLQKVQIVNEVNKDFVIEALRSIAELVTYGDQHDPSFFEFFMEKKVMKEFVRILKISKTVAVSLQLLQTISIMLQNLKNEYAIYYMLSNEHVNYLITYLFDFHNEELLSYYISFLRAISGKLNKNTISLLVKTQDEEVVSFPLYVEAIRFAFYEESMVRTAVRAITLNIYHVGDDFVNKFVASAPHSDYFSNLVLFSREQCINLSKLVSECPKNPSSESVSTILASADEIEDNLYYINDVISSGIPFVGRLITDSILLLLILPLLFPALQIDADSNMKIGAVTSLYLLCSILRIVKIKDLANIIAAAFVCPLVAFVPNSEAKLNGYVSSNDIKNENEQPGIHSVYPVNGGQLSLDIPNKASFSQVHPEDIIREKNIFHSCLPLREMLLSYATDGDDALAQGSLSVLATLLQTKEMDESVLDVLGILPQCKQHKKLLLQALIGDDSGEEKLFSFESGSIRAGVSSELVKCLQNLKEQYGVSCSFSEAGMTPCIQRNQVLDALVSLLCRSNISAETLWDGGWLLRQLLPYSEAKFRSHHRKLLKDSHRNCTSLLLQETKGIWPDLLIAVLCDEWKKCKRAMEASSPWKEPKFILLPFQKLASEDVPAESSFAAGEKLSELVKVFVLLHQLQIFFSGGVLPEQLPIHPPIDIQEMSRARIAGLDVSGPKPETKIKLVHSLPCKIAFESPEECPFCFLAVSMGTSGWILLADQHLGDVRKAAPLAGTNPRIDEKDSRWLHLQIRPSTLPFEDPPKPGMRREIIVNRRWTLAFEDDESCKAALSMILEEINLQSNEVQRRLKPVLDLDL